MKNYLKCNKRIRCCLIELIGENTDLISLYGMVMEKMNNFIHGKYLAKH